MYVSVGPNESTELTCDAISSFPHVNFLQLCHKIDFMQYSILLFWHN